MMGPLCPRLFTAVREQSGGAVFYRRITRLQCQIQTQLKSRALVESTKQEINKFHIQIRLRAQLWWNRQRNKKTNKPDKKASTHISK